MKVLVAGGAGYIGNTICAALQEAGHLPIILDSLVTGEQQFAENYKFYRGDIDDLSILKRIVNENGALECAIHLAGFISVPESTQLTFEYYRENISKTIQFLYNLNEVNCKNVIFSSSASIYGNSDTIAVNEDSKINPGSPYAKTKAMIEEIIKDYCECYDIRGIALRYFNPIGADPKMRSGSYAKNPSHLLGRLTNALKTNTTFTITGTDWPTRDGTGIRDYIHVWDLATAHVCAVNKINDILNSQTRFIAINIGRGEGVTVKEFVNFFEKVVNKKLNIQFGPPRPGDVAGAYAICERAKELLGWQAQFTIEDGIRDALSWDKKRGLK